MVSHELRTPAAALELVAETFHERADRLTPEDMEHVKSVLLRRSRDLRQLIETLLDSAIADTGSARLALRPVSWRESLTTWSETVQAHTGREISLSLPPEDVITLADPAKMERVVANLLGNAAKFSPPGTAIWLGLRTTQGELVMTVADEGIGIPDEARGRIFERFVQVESGSTRETGGVGLGLYLVQEFVGLHGGTVGVASTGLGSAFTVRLPLVAAQPDESWDLPVHRRTGLAAAAS
jgi:signal transduction histidine kinase